MDRKQVQDIIVEGLRYLDEAGKVGFVDFLTCYQNFVAWATTPEALKNVKEWNHLNDDGLRKYVQDMCNWRVVAGRNYDGFPEMRNPYIEFYTEPPTRFEFKTRHEFDQVIHQLKEAGWRTRDLI